VLCHRYCGLKMELHHIVQRADGGEDSHDNCIPLCFDCHAEVGAYNTRHPKGRKFTPRELRAHRDRWYGKVERAGGPVSFPETRDVDCDLFRRIREMLPSDTVIRFLREHDFGGGFRADAIEGVYDYLRFAETPDCEFLDPTLEGLRASLTVALCAFTRVCGRVLFSREGEGWEDWREVAREWRTLGAEGQQRFKKAVRSLNKLSRGAVKAYDAFIRHGRRTLAVP
jgi:hypothetical protein